MKRTIRRSPPPPITPETTSRNAKKWLNIVRYGESGTVIQLQDDCEYRVLEIISDHKMLIQVLGPYYRKYLLGYIQLDSKDLHSSIHETLIKLCLEKKLGTRGILSGLSNAELLNEIGQKGYDVGLFISHVTSLLTPETMQPLIELESLVRRAKNFSVIVFSELDITHPSFSALADKCSFLFDHIIKYPLYEKADSKQFLLHYGTQWNFSIPEKITQEIIRLSGGYLWIAHQIFRYLRDNPAESIDSACRDEALVTKLTTIWDKLNGKQKELLRRVHFGTLTETDKASHEYGYLLTIKFIEPTNDSLQLGIPLFSQIIENELKLSKWHIKDGKILIGGKDLTELFTKKEKAILSLLINSKKTLVSRDAIAKTLWGETPEDTYSDWAIDRLVFRLRTKLKKTDAKNELIKTVKKKGFIFG
jgi:DNA-binding winged helix-turn-helix (wHTH) protein